MIRSKRFVATVACAGLAAAITVAVSVALCATVQCTDENLQTASLTNVRAPAWYVRDYSRIGATRYVLRPVLSESNYQAYSAAIGRRHEPLQGILRDRVSESPANEHPGNVLVIDVRGFPFKAFWCAFRYNDWPYNPPNQGTGRPSLEGGIYLRPAAAGTSWADVQMLPYRVLWVPAGANFAVAFVAWLATLLGFGRAYRWRRIKRGLCPKCAYPVGTSDVCTECGARVRHP